MSLFTRTDLNPDGVVRVEPEVMSCVLVDYIDRVITKHKGPNSRGYARCNGDYVIKYEGHDAQIHKDVGTILEQFIDTGLINHYHLESGI